jgi:dolichol-phosphate mannosyltransferase
MERSTGEPTGASRPDGGDRQTIEIIVPVYNEEAGLASFHERLASVVDRLPYAFSVCYVDDGSRDRSADVLERIQEADRRVRVIHLSRNFGHQAALTAGLDQADTDAVITIDADGQHPPELIGHMVELFLAGFDVVLTQRGDGRGTPLLKRVTSRGFYRLLNLIGDTKLAPNAADFRLLSREVVDALRQMPEYHRFLRGMIAWAGYPTAIVPFEAGQRLAGRSKYSMRKMLRLAMDAVFSFSLVPLYVGVLLGVLFLALAVAEVVYVGSMWLSGGQDQLVPGWSSLMFMLLIVGGTVSTILGIMGIYLGYIFQEVKRRPAYLRIQGRARVADRDLSSDTEV